VMAATVKVKMKTERPLMTRGAVLEEVKDHLPVRNIQALYRCGEARDWYFTFDSPSIVDEVGDTHFIGKSGAEVEVERIDKRRVRFRVHWYPFFMDISSIEQHMDRFGSRIQLEYETQNYDGVRIKTGTISGTMISTENQFQSIPYRSTVCGRPVLLTVMGRASVCLRCGQVGHQRATCPQRDQPRSYAAATRGDNSEWTIVSRKQDKPRTVTGPVRSENDKQQDEPLSGESEVGENMGPPQDKRGRGKDNGNMVPPQDKRGSGVVDEEEDMVVLETERDSREQQRCKDRKRQREPEDTNAKKAKDKEEETDLDNLDLEEVKPILSLVLHPPGSEETIEVDQ
jgi:hypothetical protein